MSVEEATRAAVIAAREASESLRRQSPGTLEEVRAQGKLTSFHPDDLPTRGSDAQPSAAIHGVGARPRTRRKPTVRQELDRKERQILRDANEDFRRGRSDEPSGQFWPHNGKPITRHEAAVLDLARIEFERRRLDGGNETSGD